MALKAGSAKVVLKRDGYFQLRAGDSKNLDINVSPKLGSHGLGLGIIRITVDSNVQLGHLGISKPLVMLKP